MYDISQICADSLFQIFVRQHLPTPENIMNKAVCMGHCQTEGISGRTRVKAVRKDIGTT